MLIQRPKTLNPGLEAEKVAPSALGILRGCCVLRSRVRSVQGLLGVWCLMLKKCMYVHIYIYMYIEREKVQTKV